MINAGRSHFVYWMFDVDGNCLYVGCTQSPEQRWNQHRRSRPEMVIAVAFKKMSGPYTFTVARQIERDEQRRLRPKFGRPVRSSTIDSNYDYGEWLSVLTVAERAGIARRTVQHHITIGRLKARKLGKNTAAYVVHSDDLKAYLADRERRDLDRWIAKRDAKASA